MIRCLVLSLVIGLAAGHVKAYETRTPLDGVTLTGVFSQGGLVHGRCAQPCTVQLNDASVRVDDTRAFVLGFGRDAARQQTLTVSRNAQAQNATLILSQRRYQVQRITGVPQGTVTPDPVLQARIAREQQWVDAARRDFNVPPAWPPRFQWPLEGRISGVFGSQRVYNGTPGNPHNGLDIAATTGTPVHAPAPGVVTLAKPDLYLSGGTLIVDHGHGLFSSFIHLSALDVKVGDIIRTGDRIGRVGATGRATGPHLHWSLNWFRERLDPALVLPLR